MKINKIIVILFISFFLSNCQSSKTIYLDSSFNKENVSISIENIKKNNKTTLSVVKDSLIHHSGIFQYAASFKSQVLCKGKNYILLEVREKTFKFELEKTHTEYYCNFMVKRYSKDSLDFWLEMKSLDKGVLFY